MADLPNDTLVWPVASDLLDCLCAQVPDVCSCSLLPGSLAVMDFCSCNDQGRCGQAFVRVDSVFPSNAFPSQVTTTVPCATLWAARFHVGVFRCIPTLHDNGDPPDAVEQTEATRLQLADMAAILRAIDCCPAMLTRKALVGVYTPLSAADCGGGYWTVTVQVTPNG